MKQTIFYSWQSDLPNNTNWSFIENCLESSLKELKKCERPINIFLDRATREETGSPDITESIFSKISNSSVFIADISIVNNFDCKEETVKKPNVFVNSIPISGTTNKENYRKTPNPNVLIELGYAARTLGWEKIICIFNTDYGSFDDLPFDLRNRRIMTYSLKDKEKSEEKKNIASQIFKAIQEMNSKGILSDKILDFLKKEIDQEILGVISHLLRFINKKNEKINFFKEISIFLDYKKEDIINTLKHKKVIGFYLFKSFHVHEDNFNKFIIQALGSQYYNREILNALIDLYEWFSIYSKMWGECSDELFNQLEIKEESLFVIHSSQVSPDKHYDKRYLLMEKVAEEGKVYNFGDFYPGHIDKLLNYYTFNEAYIEKYAEAIVTLIESINHWISITNSEMIIDLIKKFKIQKI